ncbi:MAG: DUF3330 domain-containing protein [Microcoleus sp.]
MATNKEPNEVNQVACECETCAKQVPISEAKVPEARELILYFCGLDCHEKWQNQSGKPKDRVEPPQSEVRLLDATQRHPDDWNRAVGEGRKAKRDRGTGKGSCIKGTEYGKVMEAVENSGEERKDFWLLNAN